MIRPYPGFGAEAAGLPVIELLPAFATIAVGLMVFGEAAEFIVKIWAMQVNGYPLVDITA